MRKKCLSILLALCMVASLLPVVALAGSVANCTGPCEHEAAIGVTHYDTLQEAIDAAQDGQTVTLRKYTNLSDAISIDKNIVIDLGGKTIDSAAGGFDLAYYTPGSTLTLKNGTLNTATWGVWVQKGGKLTVDSNMTINTLDEIYGNKPAVVVQNAGSTVNVYGTLTAKIGTALSGIGNADDGGVVINIYEGATIASESSAAVYFPNSDTISISGGTITGDVGIQMCAGTLTITGNPTITGTGTDKRNTKTGDGDIPDGAAVSIVDRGYPGGVPNVVISSGSFRSAHTESIMAYSWLGDGSWESWNENTKPAAVSGGLFTTDVTKYCATGLMAVKNEDGNTEEYTFRVGEVPDVDATTAVSAGKTDAAVSDSIETNKDAVVTAAGGVAPDTNDTALAGATDAVTVDDTDKKDAAKQLAVAGYIEMDEQGNITSTSEITIVKEPYLEVTVTGYTTDAYDLDISAKYNLKATAEEVTPNAPLPEKTVTLAAGEPLEVTETIKMVIPLPTGFVSDTNDLYVTHTKENGTQYVYPATVTEDDGVYTATFDNPNGFSSFKLTKIVAAKIGTVPYVTLAAAVDAVTDDQTITLYMDSNENVKVGRTVRFTLAMAEAVTFSGTIGPLNANTVADAGNPASGAGTYAFTYTPLPIGNNNYPYGTKLSGANVILKIDAGTAVTYQWQSAETKTGTWTDIAGATESTGTFAPTDTYWYRCLVNGEASEAVQLLKCTSGKLGGTDIAGASYSDYWYVSNGEMAYTVARSDTEYTGFGIMGKYTKYTANDSTTYWMNTTYNDGWGLFAGEDSASATDEPVLDDLRFAFDEADPKAIVMEADLAASHTVFAIEADVMIGDDEVTNYNDKASLKAVYHNDKITSVQMVGAASVDMAVETDPAFVLKYTGALPNYTWLGYYYDRVLWANNTDANMSEADRNKYTLSNGVVVAVEGVDSGMTASWTDVAAGGTVSFTFSVGSVADTGAEITATVTANSITVPNSEVDTYYAVYDIAENEIVGWTSGNGGALEFTQGIEPGKDYIVKAVKKSDTTTDGGVITPNASAVISETEVSTPADTTTDTPSMPFYWIAVKNSENGEVKASAGYAYSGTTIKLAAAPAAGYALASITVTDTLGNVITLTENDDGTYTFKVPGSKVTVQATFACLHDENCPAYHFTDLDLGLWYHDGIHFCVANDLMQGISDTHFAPDSTITRGMLAAVLYRRDGCPAAPSAEPFRDVTTGAYYADGVAWAAENGIVVGYGDGTFGPEDSITREQMAAILYRYAEYKGYDMTASGSLSAFVDGDRTSAWAVEFVEWAVGANLLQGDGDAVLAPTGTATRAEGAQILMNFCRTFEK